ncbi:MAG: peptidylprolyl isomerase [Clostridia bacterium]|nr:peptidylprolyl isomerase [Clostridia bacterium]
MAKEKRTEAEIYRAKRKARIAKASKKNQKQLLSQRSGQIIGRVLAILLVIAIVGGIVGFALSYSGVVARAVPALTMEDGTKVSRAEYRFYYMNSLNQVENYVSYNGASYGITYDSNVLPSKQEYNGEMMFGTIEGFEEGETPTWADFLAYYSKQSISVTKAQYAAAKEMGLTLTAEEEAEINETISQAASSAKNNNFSLNAYLRRVYGTGVNEKLYRQILTEQALANKVHEAKEDEIKNSFSSYTDQDYDKYYQDNIQTYGLISYLTYTVDAELAEGETAPTKDALKKAKATAKDLAGAKTEAEFVAKVTAIEEAAAPAADDDKSSTPVDYSAAVTKTDVTGESIDDEDFVTWAYGKDAAVGATKITGDDDSFTVYYLTAAAHHPDETVSKYSVRHILIQFENHPDTAEEEPAIDDETAAEEPSEDAEAAEEAAAEDAEAAEDEATEDAEAAEAVPAIKPVSELDLSKAADVKIISTANGNEPTNKTAYELAQGVLQMYLDGKHTEEAFGALATQYTEDDGSKESAGLYAETDVGQMVEPFESWAIDPARKAGDVGIVETEYGYHVMYFVSIDDTTTWQEAMVDTAAEGEAHTYLEEVNVSAAGTIAKELWLPSLEKSILKKIKKDISNSRNSASSY